jgi:hypothetical protein
VHFGGAITHEKIKIEWKFYFSLLTGIYAGNAFDCSERQRKCSGSFKVAITSPPMHHTYSLIATSG